MQDMQQLLYLRELFGGGQGWLQVGFLLCLFGVLLFRREAIRYPGWFICAWLLFALSVMVPHLLTFWLGFLQFINDGSSFRSGRGAASLLVTFQVASGPVLFGLSLIFAFLALRPGPRPQRSGGPPRHPLE